MARNGIRSKPAVRRRPFVDATVSWRWIRRMEIGCHWRIGMIGAFA
jgi:hypothetical protein